MRAMVLQRAKQTFTVNKAEMDTRVQIPPQYVVIAIPNRDTLPKFSCFIVKSKVNSEILSYLWLTGKSAASRFRGCWFNPSLSHLKKWV